MYRQALARQARLFSTSVPARKSAVDAAKDAVKNVDKTISQAAVKGIEKGRKSSSHTRIAATLRRSIDVVLEEATQATKETVGMNASEAKAKANEASGQAKGKAHEVREFIMLTRMGHISQLTDTVGCRRSEGQDGGSQGQDVKLLVQE